MKIHIGYYFDPHKPYRGVDVWVCPPCLPEVGEHVKLTVITDGAGTDEYEGYVKSRHFEYITQEARWGEPPIDDELQVIIQCQPASIEEQT